MGKGKLAGRAAIVTGAAGAIGQAVARALAAEGAGVVLADLDAGAAQAAAKDLTADPSAGPAIGCALDVTSRSDWEQVVRMARRRFGYPAVLVNNAGTLGLHGLTSVPEQEWSRVVDVCQRGTWLGMQVVAPAIALAGGGAIVNVSSVLGMVGTGAAFAYSAAKGAVRAMTTSAAVELAGQNVRVNAVSPGLVATPLTAGLPGGWVEEFMAATPMRRQATVEEIARAVLFLASPDASYITGAELPVDGGYTAR